MAVSEGLMILAASLFGISFVTNATPFFGASYTLIATGVLVSEGFSLQNFALIVLVTGLGATLAKLVMYSGALGLRKELTRNKNVRLFHEWLGRRSFYVALFVTAFVPALPLDDFIYIGAGANRARLAPMVAVTFPAKLAKSAVEIFLEFNGLLGIMNLSSSIFGLTRIESTILLSLVFLALGIILYKLDWEKLLKRAGVSMGGAVPQSNVREESQRPPAPEG